MHAGAAPAIRYSRQHDSPGLWDRKSAGSGGGSGTSARALSFGFRTMEFRTRAIHVGNERDPQTGAVVRPLHLASTYVQPGSGEWGEFDYTRSGNPTRKSLETTLADLEDSVGAFALSSGMGAIHPVTMILDSGDHIVAGADIYGGTFRLLHKIVNRAGLVANLVPT